MTTNHLPQKLLPFHHVIEQNGMGFGLGFAVVMDVGQTAIPGSVGTYWWGGAFNTFFWIDSKEALVGTLMTQHSISVQSIRNECQILAYQAVID
jgi:CubicO group peptidase (beta-lactamase class C family)